MCGGTIIYSSNEQGVSENLNMEWGACTPGQIQIL